MKFFRWDVPCQACLVFSLFLSPAVWYTYKIDCMGDKVAEAGNEIISLQDGFVLLLLFILFAAVLPPFARLCLTMPRSSEKAGDGGSFCRPFSLWLSGSCLSFWPFIAGAA